MLGRFVCMLLLGAGSIALTQGVVRGADEFGDVKVIGSLPRTNAEIERLHRASGGNACERIAEGQSLEVNSFTTVLTESDRSKKSARSIAAARHSVISVGLTMDSLDRADLPLGSRTQILDYLDKNYISIQVRVRRDLLDGKLYFHHRPLAVTAQYRGSKLSQKFEPIVSNAVREFRSIGLFAKPSKTRTPEELRTLVLLFKNTSLKSGGRTGDQFEFAFVRGRESKTPGRLETHVFVTSEERSQLTYLNPYTRPSSSNDCSIRGAVAITEFNGLYPKDSAVRNYRLDARRIFPMTNIDAYCKSHDLEGGLYDHLDTVLDVLIDQMNPVAAKN
jgi:hypothetical protein